MHRCLFRGCKKNVPADLAMCWEHWTMLPDNIKRGIRGSYVPGQTIETASSAWHLAIAASEAWVIDTFGAEDRSYDRGRWERLCKLVRERDEARAARHEATAKELEEVGAAFSHLSLVP